MTKPIEISAATEAQMLAVNRTVARMLAKYSADVLVAYPRLVAATRTDAGRRIRPVSDLINGLRISYEREFSDKEATFADTIAKISERAIADNLETWRDNLVSHAKTKTGKAFAIAQEPGIPRAVSKKWTDTQMDLIKKMGTDRVPPIPFEHFQRLEKLVQEAVHDGVRVEELKDRLRGLDGITKRRAEVIARDQVVKYNGKMTEIRHKDIGVRRYRWRTSKNGRVRDEHRAREGKLFYYARPPKDGAPGESVQCRCYADPDLEDVLARAEGKK